MTIRRFLHFLVLFALAFSLVPSGSAYAYTGGQDDPAGTQAKQLLTAMSPEERVGQLFLVSFTGPAAGDKSQIYDLVVRHHVGGVILSAANDNFSASPDTIPNAYKLIAQLQRAEWRASLGQPAATDAAVTVTPGLGPTPVPPQYVPLFVGISQGGDGYPGDQILSGLTPLPDLMAIGATWDPKLAGQVGSVAGMELSALGFNFYIGPSLDVLETPESTLGNGLAANVFGGDPYWVGALGSAYISGLHSGSKGRMVVIADHFPGRGSSDRPSGGEPATVRKSLEQLKQIELAPFFAVTGNAQTTQGTVDGLLVSHIRYQGFQGNIRSTTRPVSFDPQALTQILALSAFTSWRSSGGLMVTDDLGTQTVRSFYDPGGSSFSAKLVARDAFLAGNDMLYMGNIVSSDAADNYSTILQTMDFFTQKYREDPAFAKLVDDAVLRILAAKYRIYGSFYLDSVIPAEAGLTQIGQVDSQAVTFDVARRSATLVSPETALDLETVLPSPPAVHDHIVFITDTRSQRQCSTCPEQPLLAVDALQNAILRLYGLQSGGQVMGGRLISYSLDSVSAILQGGTGNQEFEDAVRSSNWVVLSILDTEPGLAQTTLFRRFLSERQDILRDKHVIVFSFNAPYYLDSTDISKMTAYYCLYSKSPAFVEVAARLLFRELTPGGTLPVSVSGIGYDLLTATSPDPNQVISLSLDLLSTPTPTGLTTPEATATPHLRVGDTVTVRTGVIVDHNGHPVPDGTGVQFKIVAPGNTGVVQQITATTVQGIATAPFNIDRPGLLEIRASSDPAVTSVVLQVNVSSEGFSVTVVAPTEANQATPTPVNAPTPNPNRPSPISQGFPGIEGWLVMLLVLGGLGYLTFWSVGRLAGARWSLRWTICVVLGGLAMYTYLALQLPGAADFLQTNGWLGLFGMIVLGAVIGAGGACVWFLTARKPKKQSN
jgi:beta-N-acetylhexosaminidase